MLYVGDPQLDFEKLFLRRQGKNDLKTHGLTKGQAVIFMTETGLETNSSFKWSARDP